ncbi:MAG TPA: helix-turn-helix domain-containing protein [Tianweitania sediminis]|jgi:predicted DNA-binding transcriptional regulator AlpA|nr:helix-turn-helix domain-containing protein [Tianweitania sediminis]
MHLNHDPLLNTKRAAHYLGLSASLLEKWRTRGEGPRFIKLGRAIRYRLSDLEAFLAEGVHRTLSRGPKLPKKIDETPDDEG